MRKTVSVACALILVLGLWVSGALAYDFNDNTLAVPYIGNSAVGAPVDVIGDSIFDTKGANLTGKTLTIYTNWGPALDGSVNAAVKTADIFFDVCCDGDYDYAIRLDTLTGRGNVYQNPTYQTSQTIFSSLTNLEYGGRYDVDDAAHTVPVWATSDAIGLTSVVWDSGGANSTNKVDIFIDGIANQDFGFIWGTATCANDAFKTCVPVPPSVLLMGSGLLGLGLVGWRRRGSADLAPLDSQEG
jgi:hypothetical protein